MLISNRNNLVASSVWVVPTETAAYSRTAVSEVEPRSEAVPASPAGDGTSNGGPWCVGTGTAVAACQVALLPRSRAASVSSQNKPISPEMISDGSFGGVPPEGGVDVPLPAPPNAAGDPVLLPQSHGLGGNETAGNGCPSAGLLVLETNTPSCSPSSE